ncbi:hypothetical protein K0B96_06125 [Horticoccus luteus]|uniref:Uncharacterized protein n=1 Tax=Horticoccus luteus TaxID=2862869 RepID=A0A8F9TVU4_9BACT|nr:hypothetical protein [Horticoccus luteus]QYM80189.1 hypothetical protein K0B96_06125 [Horticoccus luteus]
MPKIVDTRKNGIKYVSNFHDGVVVGMKSELPDLITVWCVTPGGKQFIFNIYDVFYFRCSEFTGSNIINNIDIYESPAVPLEPFSFVSGLISSEWVELVAKRNAEFNKRNEGCLVDITTSDGARITILSGKSSGSVKVDELHCDGAMHPKRIRGGGGGIT